MEYSYNISKIEKYGEVELKKSKQYARVRVSTRSFFGIQTPQATIIHTLPETNPKKKEVIHYKKPIY
jgi:hypothetical protein